MAEGEGDGGGAPPPHHVPGVEAGGSRQPLPHSSLSAKVLQPGREEEGIGAEGEVEEPAEASEHILGPGGQGGGEGDVRRGGGGRGRGGQGGGGDLEHRDQVTG